MSFEKWWYTSDKPQRPRTCFRVSRVRGVSCGVAASTYELGSHYEWEGDNQVWFDDQTYDAALYLLLWKVELFYVRVRPSKRFGAKT